MKPASGSWRFPASDQSRRRLSFRLSATAERHLAQVYEYIRRDKPDAALGVIERILDGIEQLTRFPNSGRAGRSGTRELVLSPYVVVYRMIDDVVDVLSIFHGSRKYETL